MNEKEFNEHLLKDMEITRDSMKLVNYMVATSMILERCGENNQNKFDIEMFSELVELTNRYNSIISRLKTEPNDACMEQINKELDLLIKELERG